MRREASAAGIPAAVARRSTPELFDWLVPLISLQGISDAAALAFQREHGTITWREVEAALAVTPSCPRLRSWWYFECGYRKGARTCAEPDHLPGCPLPAHDLRKGSLNESAYGLHLFIRQCGGDLVGGIDARLAAADKSADPITRAQTMRDAVLKPLVEVPGVGRKLAAMTLGELLLGGDPARERWVTAGAAMVPIDSLIHAFLHRTGTLHRHGRPHPYGPACYGPGGCAAVIEAAAVRIDGRDLDPGLPAYAPRAVAYACWHLGAEAGRATCNGRRIDDRTRCTQNLSCPAYRCCDRLPLRP